MKTHATQASLILLLSIARRATPYQLPSLSITTKYSHTSTTNLIRRSSTGLHSRATASTEHTVNGLKCVEITIPLPKIKDVTILEANADSQDTLVNSALEDPDDDNYKLNADDPYGAVLWPSARTLTEYLLVNHGSQDDNTPLNGLSILELGAGT